MAIFSKLEIFNGEKYPEYIKEMLFGCGYDTIISLRRINENTVATIEEYVASNAYLLISIKKNSEQYRKQTTFQILPGHKEIIMNIPSQISEMEQSKCRQKKPKSMLQMKPRSSNWSQF